MEELAEPVPVFSAATSAVTALKVEGFPPSSHLSHPAKLPQSQDKDQLVRTCPAPSQAQHLAIRGIQAGRRQRGRAQLPAALCSSPASGSEGSGLDTGVLAASGTQACRPDLGPEFCSPDSGTLPEPRCRDPSEVTQLSDPPSGSQGSGLSHPAADRMVAPGSQPPGIGVALPHQGD